MTKIRLALVLALVAAPAAMQAQTANSNATLNVTGKVQSYFNMSVSRALDFGTMTVNVAKTVAPGATSGLIAVNFNIGANITVTGGDLTNGTTTFTPTYNCNNSNASDGTGLGTAYACSAGTTVGTAGTGNVGTTRYIYVGGIATPPANAAAGSYTGTMTFAATYNTF